MGIYLACVNKFVSNLFLKMLFYNSQNAKQTVTHLLCIFFVL